MLFIIGLTTESDPYLFANHYICLHTPMAYNVKTPPKFDRLNFLIWKVKMTIFLQSLGSRVAKDQHQTVCYPDGDEDTWSKITAKEFEANAKAHYNLLQA